MATSLVLQDHRDPTLAWRSAGPEDAPVAVFLHGLGGRRSDWDPLLTSLADVRLGLAWDAPGYGDSPGLIGSLEELAGVAADWIRSLDRGRVDVVGLSFGGMVAQHLVLDHPDVVRTLALLDTSPAFGLDGVTTPESWLASRLHTAAELGDGAERARRIVEGLVGAACPEQVRATAADSIAAVAPDALAAACRALVRHDTRPRLHEITAPTLVMVGAEDTETPESYARAISSRIPDAELVVVPGAGHLLNLEAPEAVSDALRRHWVTPIGGTS